MNQITLAPGWLARDIARATERVNKWRRRMPKHYRLDDAEFALVKAMRNVDHREAHIRELAALMLPGKIPTDAEEFLQAGEYGLALEAVACEVMAP